MESSCSSTFNSRNEVPGCRDNPGLIVQEQGTIGGYHFHPFVQDGAYI
jgi:hypothetical protein